MSTQRATMAQSLETQLYLTHPARFLDATPFTVGEAVRGAITPIFDMDWFRYRMAGPG